MIFKYLRSAHLLLGILSTWPTASGQIPGPSDTYYWQSRNRLLLLACDGAVSKQERMRYLANAELRFPDDAFKRLYFSYLDQLNQNEPNIDLALEYIFNKYGISGATADLAAKTALFYFNQKKYKEASHYFEMAREAAAPYRFEQAICAMVQHQYHEAICHFQQVNDRSELTDLPFYIGYCHYRIGAYHQAIESFNNIRPQSRYSKAKEYCISICYYFKPDKEKAVEHAEQALTKGVESPYVSDLHLLVGMHHYDRMNFSKAAAHLQQYEASAQIVGQEEQYALAMCLQKTGEYKNAIPRWQSLADADGPIGHFALLHLAECRYAVGDYQGAIMAFKKASQCAAVGEVQRKASYLYGKSLAMVKRDAEALKYLSAIPPNDLHFDEAQSLIKDILLRTEHIDAALKIIDSLTNQGDQIWRTRHLLYYFKALELLSLHESPQAKALLLQVTQQSKDPALVAKCYFRLAEIHYAANDFVQAQGYLRQVNVQGLGTELSPYYYYTAAYIHLQLNQVSEALSSFQKCMPYAGQMSRAFNEDVQLRIADCYAQLKQYDQAIILYGELRHASNSHAAYARLQYANFLMGMHRKDSAATAFEEFLEKHPESHLMREAKWRLGLIYESTGRQDKAVKIWSDLATAAFAEKAYYNDALLKLGLHYYQRNDYETAIGFYTRVLERKSDPDYYQTALASIKEIYTINLNNPQAYIEFVEKIGNPLSQGNRDSVLFETGEFHFHNKEYEKAIGPLSAYVTNHPTGLHIAKARFYRAECYMLLKRFDEALEDFRDVISKLQGEDKKTALQKAIAIAYEHNKQYRDCIHWIKEYLPMCTDKKQYAQFAVMGLKSAYYQMQSDDVYYFADKIDGAYIHRADSINLGYMVGKIAYQRGDFQKALSYLNGVTKLTRSAKALEAKYLIAQIYFNKGEYLLAEKMTDRLIQDAFEHPEWIAKGLLLIADIYIQQGEWFSARASLDALLEQYTDAQLLEEAREKIKRIDQMEARR